MVSTDNGMNWHDQGLVLEAPADSMNCETVNHYFTGGNGDFCVNVDNEKQYVYFFISTYNKDVAEQGVALARMKYADRDDPKGKVFKWHKGQWNEPGIGGHVTPIFPSASTGTSEGRRLLGLIHPLEHVFEAMGDAAQPGPRQGLGPGGHLRQLQPRTRQGRGLEQARQDCRREGVGPVEVVPQVVGLDAAAHETDKLAGKKARLFVAGLSRWEIEFYRPGETRPAAE